MAWARVIRFVPCYAVVASMLPIIMNTETMLTMLVRSVLWDVFGACKILGGGFPPRRTPVAQARASWMLATSAWRTADSLRIRGPRAAYDLFCSLPSSIVASFLVMTALVSLNALFVRRTRLVTRGVKDQLRRYCLHFHLMHRCPRCVLHGNAVVNSTQIGITVHGTHQSKASKLWMNEPT